MKTMCFEIKIPDIEKGINATAIFEAEEVHLSKIKYSDTPLRPVLSFSEEYKLAVKNNIYCACNIMIPRTLASYLKDQVMKQYEKKKSSLWHNRPERKVRDVGHKKIGQDDEI